MNEKKNKILQYCKNENREVTAKEILNELYPDKQQSDVNRSITELVYECKLIRNDNVRPYTVRIPLENEKNWQIKDYSRKSNAVSNISNIEKKVSRADVLPDDLKNFFNKFWGDFFGDNRDYYGDMGFEQLVQLKIVVGKINNLITYESSVLAVELIAKILDFSEKELMEIKELVDSSNVNANGYDIEYSSGSIRFVCEVKGTIPASGKDKFGAAQEKEIRKDFDGLLEGKTKSTISKQDLNDYYKFMCFYNHGNNSIKAVNCLVDKLNSELKDVIEIWEGQENLNKEKVYVFLVKHES